MLNDILLAFIPVFVAVDAIGVLPVFVSLTRGFEKRDKKKVIVQSFWTAICLAFAFILLGKAVFRLLGITMGDFMVAGGGVLFSIAIMDLLKPGKQRRVPPEQLGAVPLGTPLVAGPAVLTTSLMMVDQHGVLATIISVFANVLLAGIVFSCSDRLMKVFGDAGSRALSKVMALLLSAIAVMMIRKGVFHLLAQ